MIRKKAQKIPALLRENEFAYSDSIKGETIALSLEKQFSLNDLSHRETENEVKKSTENFSSPPLTDNQIDNLKCMQPSESSSKRYVTSLTEQLTKNYHIQRYEFSQPQQLLFTGTSSCSAPATIPQDPDELPPIQPLPPTTAAADHLIPRTEIIQHHQLTITGDLVPFGSHGPQKLLASL
ncbi:hypothetical protein AVEN_114243-1 [Araneus ventricosus]|uniref:Uncharacterized protein n=1 Tax=Araneus ventricosus TaxID=182803 RepID=A0A4Y2VD19_ARAVE|nr:hypothetical protein AVEN_53618-1 [Araneus ventricosus]GBO22285.1 hypothetical protein AVEN_114243-1 [Araneus ventricosus]